MLANVIEDMLAMKGHRLDAHLVALQPHRIPLCGLNHGASGGVSEAIDDPVACRRIPGQLSCCIHLGG